MKPRKATHEQLRVHNRRMVLRALYSGDVNTRVALAAATGLTKPTISNLISELMEEGLVSESGRGNSTGSGGKRPTLLKFQPDSRQVIGMAVDRDRAIGVLSNLAGRPTALHVRELPDSGGAGAVNTALSDVINGLLPQLDAPLLCLGVAIPGQVDTGSGVVRHSAALGLSGETLGSSLASEYAVPVHIGNYAELCALGQLAYGPKDSTLPRTLVTVMLDGNLELGVSMMHGSSHYGSELAGPLIDELDLGWDSTKALAGSLREAQQDSLLPASGIRYLHIRYASSRGDDAANQLMRILAGRLARLLAWIIPVLQPSHVSLAGGISELGEPFLELLREHTACLLPGTALQDVSFSMAYSGQLGAMGAVALAIQSELELLS